MTIAFYFGSTLNTKIANSKDGELKMSLGPDLVFRISKAAPALQEAPGMMYINIRRPYDHLEKELLSVFKEQNDIKVIVDRRYGERRKHKQPVEIEHRRADRRRPKVELIEVLITTEI